MYQQGSSSLKGLRQEILNSLFSIISKTIPSNVYAFKGGYILKSILDGSPKTKNIRHTTDIDIDISCEEYFDLIVSNVSGYLESLKVSGKIFDYGFKPPVVTGIKNISGTVRVYAKNSPNSRKFVLCGMDIGVHPLFYGIITLNNGTQVFSIERMLADKFNSMYFQNEKGLKHRAKDIMDIYLIQQYISERGIRLDLSLLLTAVKERLREMKVSLPSTSALEIMYLNKHDSIYQSVYDLIRSERITQEFLSYESVDSIIQSAIGFINYVRSNI